MNQSTFIMFNDVIECNTTNANTLYCSVYTNTIVSYGYSLLG